MKTYTSIFKSNLTDHHMDNDQLNNNKNINEQIINFYLVYVTLYK